MSKCGNCSDEGTLMRLHYDEVVCEKCYLRRVTSAWFPRKELLGQIIDGLRRIRAVTGAQHPKLELSLGVDGEVLVTVHSPVFADGVTTYQAATDSLEASHLDNLAWHIWSSLGSASTPPKDH